LTDIAVSRKHFDLRNEAGAWVLADRGSGNGTLVNGNIEDQPFILANGDQIEIGNTTFRFEQAGGTPAPPPPPRRGPPTRTTSPARRRSRPRSPASRCAARRKSRRRRTCRRRSGR